MGGRGSFQVSSMQQNNARHPVTPVRFIDKQLENKKTSRVLEAAFGEEWGQTYMREV